MSTVAEYTLPEKILIAASSLEDAGQSPFSAEALIVSAWQHHPRTFGLKGYAEQFPDSNKVLSSIMGEKGLARRGWLSKVGQKMYSLTREGRGVVRRLLREEASDDAVESPSLSEKLANLMYSLLDTPAVEKIREGRNEELTFAEASKFWNISNGLSAAELDARLDKMDSNLEEVVLQLENSIATLRDGREVSSEEASLLNQAHIHMKERFSRHLTLLRNRGGRA